MPNEQLIWMDGTLVPAADARISVFDHGLLYGDGVFEGLRIYNRRILKLRTHLDRLWNSARSIQLRIPYTEDELEQAVRQTVAANEKQNGYIRLVVTRGSGTLGINPYQCPRAFVFIIVGDIQVYPAKFYQEGLSIISSATLQKHPATLSPRVKSLNYLANVLAKLEAIAAGVEEAVLYNAQGYVTECVVDNIFAVQRRRGGQVINTPPLHAGLLEGVTRNLVIELAEQAGYEVHQNDMTRHDLYSAQEIFLTGTGAEVVPVVKVDGRSIGDGKPGAVTGELMRLYRQLIENAPED
ncbi:MAG: branched-chain-amino-acid transaminase [Pirellulaceae bacterium]|nr:branched-chain-amino-acid transaminase [Pirellulaceae bacterium]